MGERLASFICF